MDKLERDQAIDQEIEKFFLEHMEDRDQAAAFKKAAIKAVYRTPKGRIPRSGSPL